MQTIAMKTWNKISSKHQTKEHDQINFFPGWIINVLGKYVLFLHYNLFTIYILQLRRASTRCNVTAHLFIFSGWGHQPVPPMSFLFGQAFQLYGAFVFYVHEEGTFWIHAVPLFDIFFYLYTSQITLLIWQSVVLRQKVSCELISPVKMFSLFLTYKPVVHYSSSWRVP